MPNHYATLASALTRTRKTQDLGNCITPAKKKCGGELECKLKAKSGGGEVDVKVDGTLTVKQK